VHPSIYEIGQKFFETYWDSNYMRILEIGAQNVNGTLRAFQPPGSSWTGIDLSPGDGVDLVLDDPHTYPFADGHFDVIVSTSCYEHDPMFWLTFLESCRVLSDRGIMYISAPSCGVYHAYPFDHWRFWPDAGVGLEMWGRRMKYPVSLIESFIDCAGPTSSGYWNSLTMIFNKNANITPAARVASKIEQASDIRVGTGSPLQNRRL
jgi:hypothetical protein